MSWRSQKSQKYNRAEEQEYWLTLIQEQYDEYNCWWWMEWDDDVDDERWRDYYGRPGYVANMEELHKMKLLTLLRSLNIKSTIPVLKEAGW